VDIAPLNSAANIAATISQRTKMMGKKQQKTTNAAAIHLNMIFRTDPNGMSKSSLTRVAMTTRPAAVVEERQGLGSRRQLRPVFQHRQIIIDRFHSPPSEGLQGVFRSIRPSANICATCASAYGPSSQSETFTTYDFMFRPILRR
jgi:hypothetical protein